MGHLINSLVGMAGATTNAKPTAPPPAAPSNVPAPNLDDMMAALSTPSNPSAQAMQAGAVPNQQSQAGISMADLYSPAMQQPAPAATQDNPYTPYDNSIPQDVAQNVGTPDNQNPITITGDSWKPKEESLIQHVGDFMLGGDHFKNKVDKDNLVSAMKGFQKDPEQAINRIRQLDPKLAWTMEDQLSGMKANQALEQQRVQARQDTGRDRLGNMLGSVTSSKDPTTVYEKQLPMMRKYAESYGLDPSELPDTYDADTINGLRSQGISTYDQGRLQQEGANSAALQQYRSTEIALSKLGKQIDMGNLGERIKNDQITEQNLGSRTVLEAKRQAAAEGVTKDADGNTVGMGVTLNSAFAPYLDMKPGQYVVSPDKTQVLMKKPDGYVYKYPLKKRKDGSAYIDLDNPIIRGTTVDGYVSK